MAPIITMRHAISFDRKILFGRAGWLVNAGFVNGARFVLLLPCEPAVWNIRQNFTCGTHCNGHLFAGTGNDAYHQYFIVFEIQ